MHSEEEGTSEQVLHFIRMGCIEQQHSINMDLLLQSINVLHEARYEMKFGFVVLSVYPAVVFAWERIQHSHRADFCTQYICPKSCVSLTGLFTWKLV